VICKWFFFSGSSPFLTFFFFSVLG